MPSHTYSPELEASIRESVAVCRSIRAGNSSLDEIPDGERLTRFLPRVWSILAKRPPAETMLRDDCIEQLGGLTEAHLSRFFQGDVAVL